MKEPHVIECPVIVDERNKSDLLAPLAAHVVPETMAGPGDPIGFCFELHAASPHMGQPMIIVMGDGGRLTRMKPFEINNPLLMQAVLHIITKPGLSRLMLDLVRQFKEDSEDTWWIDITPQSLMLVCYSLEQIARILREEADIYGIEIDDVPVSADLIGRVAAIIIPKDRSAHRRMQESAVLACQARRLEAHLSRVFDEKVLLNAHPVITA